jgi:hypothetical protein
MFSLRLESRERRDLIRRQDAKIEVRRQGNMSGWPISAQTAFCFIEHVGSMLLSAHMGPSPIAPYGECGQDLVQQAVLFCGRGLGFTEDVLNRHVPKGACQS